MNPIAPTERSGYSVFSIAKPRHRFKIAARWN
jgi:hypothetical protein